MVLKKFSVGDKSAATLAKEEGAQYYNGETPPKGIYTGKLKRLAVSGPNRSDDFMFNGFIEIDEPKKSPKSQYNGYGIRFNLNISDQGAGYVNQFLDAISGGNAKLRSAFWARGVDLDGPKGADTGPVLKIGGLLATPDNKITVTVNTRMNEYPKGSGDWSLQVGQFLLANTNSSAEDEGEEDEGEEDEAAEDDEQYEDGDGEDGDGEEDEEGEEEGEETYDEEGRRVELGDLGRTELIKIAKELGIKALKSMSEDDYIDKIVAAEAESDEPPF